MLHRLSSLLGGIGDQESKDETLETPPPPDKRQNRKQQAKSSQDVCTTYRQRTGCAKQAKRPHTSSQQDTGSAEAKKPKQERVAKQAKSHRSISLASSQTGTSKAMQTKRGRPKKIMQEGSDKEFKTNATKKRDTRKLENNIPTETFSELENKGVPAKRAKNLKVSAFKTSKKKCSTFPANAASPTLGFSDVVGKTGQQNFESSPPDLEDNRSCGSSRSEHVDELVENCNDELELSSLKKKKPKKFRQNRKSQHISKDSSSSSELEDTEKQPVKWRFKKTSFKWPLGGSSARPRTKKKEKGERPRSKSGPIECKVCSRLIRCKAVMERHMLTHTGEKPFECDDCGRRYTSSSNLRIHQQIHTGKMDYSCEQCGQKFTHLSYLKRHLLRHSDKRQHMCDQCGKGFIQKYHLERHLLVHSGKMPYACDKCDAAFNRTDYLSLHMRNVHLSNDGEREMKAKPNKPFKCDMCEKAFTTRTSLESHTRVHTGVTPYSCGICLRKFKQSSQMNAHLRTHSGEKPHTCDVCGIKFSRKNYVRIHKEKKHVAKKVFQQC